MAIDKKEAIEYTDTLIKSCEEGLDGRWDCTTDEGKETGFTAMIGLLEEIKNYIKETKT